jgi:hypothetical protein
MYFCGGTVISKRWVVTVAHCLHEHAVDALPPLRNSIDEIHDGRIEVVLGTANLDRVAPENVYQVQRYVIHPAYQLEIDKLAGMGDPEWVRGELNSIAQSFGNNIALIRLDRDWNGPVARLRLDSDSYPCTDCTLWTAGFGRTDNRWTDIYSARHTTHDGRLEFYAFAPRLHEASLQSQPLDACRQQYPGAHIGAGEICASPYNGGFADCAGDSGGPVVELNAAGTPQTIALSSWGGPVCNSSGVYTRLSAHAEWLRAATGLPLGGQIKPANSTSEINSANPTPKSKTSDYIPKPSKPLLDKDLLTGRQSNELVRQLRELLGLSSAKLEVSIEDRNGRTIGPTLRLGNQFVLSIKSTIAGSLVIIDVNAAGETTLIYPSRFARESDLGLINPAEMVRIPGPGYPGFTHFEAAEPVGKGRLFVLVVPRDFNIERQDAPRQAAPSNQKTRQGGLSPREQPTNYLMRFVGQIAIALRLRDRVASGSLDERTNWAFETYDYEIVRKPIAEHGGNSDGKADAKKEPPTRMRTK